MTREIYNSAWIIVQDTTDNCAPPCHTLTFEAKSPPAQLPLAEFAILAERILAYEREIEIAEGRAPRKKAQPCQCGARGATLTPGPMHYTTCTLWTVEK